MERQIALLVALLLCSPFFAIAVPGTARAFPASLISFSYKESSHDNEGLFDKAIIVYSAKASDVLWANGAAFGKYYCVVCNGGLDSSRPSPCRGQGYTVVRIQANCPNCDATMNISREGFAAIADPNIANIIKIDYAQVEGFKSACA